jgi:hypothetical protein
MEACLWFFLKKQKINLKYYLGDCLQILKLVCLISFISMKTGVQQDQPP